MKTQATLNRNSAPATIAVVLGGVMWGLYWIPFRSITDSGLSGVWAGALVYAGLSLILLPVLLFRGKKLVDVDWRGVVWCGLFTGTAFTLYSMSLSMTDVVRSILLFYLTPIWSTVLGVLFLGERLTVYRLCALLLGLIGLVIILGLGVQIPWPSNLGDWLALASGIAWSYGSYCIYKLKRAGVIEQAFAFTTGSFIISLCFIAFGGSTFATAINWTQFVSVLPSVAIVVLFVLPMIFLTLWPATLLSPGRIGLLLMGEVMVGVGSAAWLSGEPFGARETIGAAFIVAAGIVEVVRPSTS